MFVFYKSEIKNLSEEGFIDFIMDMDDNGRISASDKELMFQFCLEFLEEHLNEKQTASFLTEMNRMLYEKRNCEIAELQEKFNRKNTCPPTESRSKKHITQF